MLINSNQIKILQIILIATGWTPIAILLIKCWYLLATIRRIWTLGYACSKFFRHNRKSESCSRFQQKLGCMHDVQKNTCFLFSSVNTSPHLRLLPFFPIRQSDKKTATHPNPQNRTLTNRIFLQPQGIVILY